MVRAGYIAERKSIDGGQCEICHDSSGEIVHHVIWLTPSNIDDPDIALSYSNLKYVCHHCHDLIHVYVSDDARPRVVFDSNGNPSETPPINL